MAAQDCIAEIKAAAGGGGQALTAAAKQLADQARMTAAIAKRNALINLQTRIARRERIQSAANLIEGIKAEIHGVATPLTGGRFSAEAEWKAWSRLYQERMVNELERAGLLGAAKPARARARLGARTVRAVKGQGRQPRDQQQPRSAEDRANNPQVSDARQRKPQQIGRLDRRLFGLHHQDPAQPRQDPPGRRRRPGSRRSARCSTIAPGKGSTIRTTRRNSASS